MKRRITKESIDRHLVKIITECRDLIATVEWWNRNRTDVDPMDCEPERLLLKAALACRDERDMVKRQPLTQKMVDLATNAVNERNSAGRLQ